MNDGGLREDRLDVAEVLIRYATGIDQRDWPLLRSCFTDDCQADYGAIGVWNGADEITEWMRRTHEPLGRTMHRITNIAVEPKDRGMSARSYLDVLLMFVNRTSGTRAAGYYDDELVRTDGGWKIAERRFTIVLVQTVPDGMVLNPDDLG